MRTVSLSVCTKQTPHTHTPPLHHHHHYAHTNVDIYVNIIMCDWGTRTAMQHGGEMSINAQMENMAVHFISSILYGVRCVCVASSSVCKYHNRQQNTVYAALHVSNCLYASQNEKFKALFTAASTQMKRIWINPQQTSYEDLMYIYSYHVEHIV